MVATEQAQATRTGVMILEHGGNAVDAAVAVGYALAVTDPCCGNIGGGGFMLIHHATGGDTFINFRERAPGRARKNMYLDAHGNVVPGRSTDGWLAIGVPGTVAGLERARREYGTMTRAQVMAPALALARDGFVLAPGDVDEFGPRFAQIAKQQPNVAAIWSRRGRIVRAGERLRQPELAQSLAIIERDGTAGFYRGPIAERVVAASERNGGILSREDFRSYTSEELMPVHCRYRGYTIVSAPPPSSGGTTMCEILSIVDAYPFAAYGYGSVATIRHDVEAERLAYADRNTYLGDPDFVTNPVAQLLAPAYIAAQRSRIPERAGRSADVRGGLPAEHRQTTHYSIVDRSGNAVAVTFTINDEFGAGVIAGQTGFFLNNEMDDFTSKPGVPNLYGLVQGEANAVAPGKRPLSSMAPTIALRNGRVAIVAGSPGGSRIITITLAVLQNIIDFGMNVQAAVDAPRFHHQWLPDTVEVESGALAPRTRAELAALGYTFALRDDWGSAQAIAIDPHTGILTGGSDRRRRSGLALGW